MDRRYQRPYRVRPRFYYRSHIVKSKKRRYRLNDKKRKRRSRKGREDIGYANLDRDRFVTPELERVIGLRVASNIQIVQNVWAYVKANKLQVPGNGRFFVPDEALAAVMGTQGVAMNGFTMMRYVKNHIISEEEQRERLEKLEKEKAEPSSS